MDGAYDATLVYDLMLAHSPKADVIIPPIKNAVIASRSNTTRNRIIAEMVANSPMVWQKEQGYDRHNYFELGVQRYKRILGGAMHARRMPN